MKTIAATVAMVLALTTGAALAESSSHKLGVSAPLSKVAMVQMLNADADAVRIVRPQTARGGEALKRRHWTTLTILPATKVRVIRPGDKR